MKREKRITLGLFIIYLVLLSWLIIFKMAISINDIQNLHRPRLINLIPFAHSFKRDGSLMVGDIVNNFIAFIPVGIYLQLLKVDWSFLKKSCIPFCLSLIYEILQLIFSIGTTDITDVLTNTTGGILGILICIALQRLLKTKANTIINFLASICTVGLSILMSIIVLVRLEL